MKKNIFKKSVIFALIALLITIIVFAQQKNDTKPLSYRWEKVEQLAQKQLPESALKEVENIIAQAQKEKNTGQLMKAMLYKMRFTLEINPDKAPELIREFEAYAANETTADKQALLQSMTAELYVRFYLNDSWTINKRTQVVGNVPDDLKEWTKNSYFEKISTLLAASLQHADILQNTDALAYEILLNKGEDSRLFKPTLFDFLAYRRIQLLQEISQATDEKNPLESDVFYAKAADFATIKLDITHKNSVEYQIIKSYQMLIKSHLKTKNTQALLFADLQRLAYLRTVNQNNSLYSKALDLLEKEYASNELVIEILNEKANYYLQIGNESDENKSQKRKVYAISTDGIKRFPNYRRIDLLKNIQKQITQKSLNVHHKELVKYKTGFDIKLTSANIKQLEMNVYRINATAQEYSEYRQNQAINNQPFPNRTVVETQTIELKPSENFEAADTTIQLQSGEYGIYEVEIQEKHSPATAEKSKTMFVVSDLGYIQRVSDANFQSIYVLNRKTGNPIPKAKVYSYQNKWNGNGYSLTFKNTFISDKNGFCKLPFQNNYSNQILFLQLGNDRFFSSGSYAYFIVNKPFENEKPQLKILTDRSLYRPGQIVYFKGIAYFATKNKQEVQKSTSYEVTLYDANRQKVNTKTFKTNEFGSFAGEFVLPEGGLNGVYRIQSERFSQLIYVEEYKRPTFEVNIDKPKAEIKFGSTVFIRGNVKAFAGYNIGDARVKYRVTRTSHRYCWWWSEPETEIKSGNAVSDSNGKFDISFVAEKPKNKIETWRGSFYTYTIKADVTDPKGETQTGETNVSVGDKALFIMASIPEKVEKNSGLKMDISTETLNGETIESVVEYNIYRMENLSDYIENKNDFSNIANAEKVISGTFKTSLKTLNIDVKKWKSAQYRIVLTTKDAFGNEVKTENTFIIYDNADKSPAVKTYKWLLAPKTECAVGEKAKIRFGTSTKNTSILYEIMLGNKIIESKWLKFNNAIRDFQIHFKDEYGAGITVLFTFMKDEKFFTEQVHLTQKVAEKKLTPTLSVFRNKLQPSENAEWTVTIPESANGKKAAELLVSMYDASLDAIRPHRWNFDPAYCEKMLGTPLWQSNNAQTSSAAVYYDTEQLEVKDFQFDNLNWFGLEINSAVHENIRIRGMRSVASPMAQENSPILNKAVVAGYGTPKKMKLTAAAALVNSDNPVFQMVENAKDLQPKTKPVQIRSNFNETAFFYPQLKTDASGDVKFSFTAPESLTRWNLNLLAHTADLYFGQKQEQIVTQKELMVQMNLPRFVRRSDKIMLSANVINLTNKELKANVSFELIDPATEKVISVSDNQIKDITLAPNETKAIQWDIKEFMPYELVSCKIIATAGNFSDGEQKYLPVLPDKILVTESLPLIIRGNETRTFTFESLLKNASKVDTKNVAVEFSSNPAWYAVQALPTLSAPENENAIDYLTAYYANSLAAFIANSNPKIAKIFDLWKNAKGSRDALISNLQKNTELKNMLLEETPWVMAAQDETEQKRQIALLFDLNRQKNQSQQYLNKLLKLQTPNGGFTWYEGMPESRYITQEILLNLARLNRLTKTANCKLQTINAALTYLDLEIARDFAELKKYNKKYLTTNCIGNMQLIYLHLRSEYIEIPVHVSAQEALKYYTNQSEKYWTSLTLYGKAQLSVVAHRNGKIQLANLILKSLKENALKTDEMGMYWAHNTSGYFWDERPIAVQAAIIEAFSEINSTDRVTRSYPVNSNDIDEMKIWLLKQKQTQRWDSPTATVNAIYALLLQGSDWLANENKVTIKLGEKTLQPASTEAGTGYFKETIPTNEIKTEMGKITIHSFTPSEAMNYSGIGWGAMYWQYYQDLDKVEAQGGALKISKKLFAVNRSNEGFTQSETLNQTSNAMIPIDQAKLKIGDKVITRLVITTDRNLEFVALKDLRAACFEPLEQRSGYVWREGTGYYQTTKDASTQFFFSYLPKGTYVFEYEMWVNNSGTFTSGIASVQCQYAPEFVSHTGGERIEVMW